MSKVTLAPHPETGKLVNPSQHNPEFETVRVETEGVSFINGFLSIRKRVAFIRAPKGDFAKIGITESMKNKVLPGKIVVEESLEPFWDGQEPKIDPSTGETLLSDGKPIYRQATFTTDLEAKDTLIKTTSRQDAPSVVDMVGETADEVVVES